MTTTVTGMQVATTGSDHIAPGPPAISNTPPIPPGPGPVPAPFLYIARSSTADQTCDRLMVGGKPVLVVESGMSIQQPGNVFAKPCEASYGADIITRAVNCRAAVAKGYGKLKAGGVDVAATGSNVYMNVPTDSGKTAQSLGVLWAGLALRVAASLGAAPGAIVMGIVDPVSAATGEVFDSEEDLHLPGLLPAVVKRVLSSLRCGERTPFGLGGWTHGLHRWIEVAGDELTLRDETGGDVRAAVPAIGDMVFHRALRLEIRRRTETTFETYGLDNRLLHRFEPLVPGGRAVLRGYKDAWERRVELVYQGTRLVRVVAPLGRELRFAHDAEGRIVKAELWARGGPWKAVSYEYNAEGELSRVERPAGEVDGYAYDGMHRLVKKTLPTGLSFHYEYDEDTGRCIHSWGDGGLHEARFDYDIEKGITRVSGNPEAGTYTWDERGAVTSIESADGARAQKIAYDEDMFVVRLADAAATRNEYERDARGNLVRQVGAGGLAVTSHYENDLPTKRIDAAGLETGYAYDSRGALILVTSPSGLRTSFEYDDAGRLTAIRGADGPQLSLTYDDEDNPVTETGPFGATLRYAYDALGRVVSRTDPLGRTLQNAHDAADRVVSVTHPDGTVLRYAYDGLGRRTSVVDEAGNETRHVFAGVHSLVEHRAADGAVWTTRYDRLERARQITNARGETWEWHYDRAGRIIEERAFDGRILRYRYSQSGQPARVDRPDGTWRAFVINGDGLAISERSSHGNIQFERDEQGRVESAVVDDVTPVRLTMKYDGEGRLIEETQDGLAIRYAYDSRGRVTERVLPSGQKTRFEYDTSDRITRVEHEGRSLDLGYDAMDNEVRRTFRPAGVDIVTERDSMDRPSRQLVLGPEGAGGAAPRGLGQSLSRGGAPVSPGARTPLVDRSFGYDARGWLRATADARRGATSYEHDVAGQLVGVRRGAEEERYSYDSVGSLTGARLPGRPDAGARWAIEPGNVLVQAGDTDFAYDPARRRVRKTVRRKGAAPEETEYLWDCRDRLREVRLPDRSRIVYSYDAYARRLRKDLYSADREGTADAATPSRTVRYLWQGHSLAAEIDSERGTRVFVHGPGSYLPLLQEQAGAVYAYVCSPIGTPEELIDEHGKIAWTAHHTAWGVPLGERSAVEPAFRLLGQYTDEESGLAYVRHRYFDPLTARFLSPDPLGLDGGRNLTAFNGSPLVHADPKGLECAMGNPAIDRPFQLAPNIPPKPGYFDVIIHGYPDKVVVIDARGRQSVMTPELLAQWIRARGYTSGPIRLISCNTGQLPNGFAKQFSNAMGVTVEAPTGYAFPPQYPGGPLQVWHGVADPSVPGGIRYTTPGTWVPFTPDPRPPPAGGPTPAAPAGSPGAGPTGTIPPAAPAGSPGAGPGGTAPPAPAAPAGSPGAGPGGTAPPAPAAPSGSPGAGPGGTAPPAPAGGSGLPFVSGNPPAAPSGSPGGGAGGTGPMPAAPSGSPGGGAGGTGPMPAVPGGGPSGPGGPGSGGSNP